MINENTQQAIIVLAKQFNTWNTALTSGNNIVELLNGIVV